MAYPTGYAKLATFMAGEQYEIFRKFKSSACRDLLYLQAELKELEDEFAALSERDRRTQGEHELYDGNWRLLSTSEARNCGGEQWAKALQIREKLREYCAMPPKQALEGLHHTDRQPRWLRLAVFCDSRYPTSE